MTVTLPEPIPTSRQWQVVDFIDRRQTSAPAAGGVATVELQQLDTGERWLIDHVVISSTSTAYTVCKLYDGPPAPDRLLSGSSYGNLDEADYPGGLLLDSGNQLVAQWTGSTTGSTARIRVQARLLRRV